MRVRWCFFVNRVSVHFYVQHYAVSNDNEIWLDALVFSPASDEHRQGREGDRELLEGIVKVDFSLRARDHRVTCQQYYPSAHALDS